jgi:hypothetical protein
MTIETEVDGCSKSTNEGGPSLVRWVSRDGTRDFYPALAALVCPEQNIFFPHRTLFHFMCPQRPATWAGGRDGSPVS